MFEIRLGLELPSPSTPPPQRRGNKEISLISRNPLPGGRGIE